MKQKFSWNASTEEVEEVLEGEYEHDENEELNEVMQLVLKNCISIAPIKKSSIDTGFKPLSAQIHC